MKTGSNPIDASSLAPRPDPSVLSIVIPVFNEEEAIPHLRAELTRLLSKLSMAVEVLLVDDGSSDRSWETLGAWAGADARIKLIRLARNFGHQIAITTGLDHARGDAVVVMDADLQDPPEVVLEMIAEYRRGYEIVYAKRTEREAESWMKRATAWLFYRLMRTLVHKGLPSDVGDFRLMSRASLDALRRMREHHRFIRGMVAWTGFSHTMVTYRRAARVAGTTKYPLRKMLAFAWTAAISFSALPLRVCFFLGSASMLIGILFGLYALVCWMLGVHMVKGWTSLIIVICLASGSLQMSVGIVGEYVARIFEEVKDRPLYVVWTTVNLENSNVRPLHEVRNSR